MGTKTGELRETLIAAIAAVQAGKMDASQAKSIAALAGQVNLSLQVEINLRREALDMGKSKDALPEIGQAQLGDGARPAIDAVSQVVPEPRAEPSAIGQPRFVKGHAMSGSR